MVRGIDLGSLGRSAAESKRIALRQIAVDEVYFGKQQKFITVADDLESAAPLWFGGERKPDTLDGCQAAGLRRRLGERSGWTLGQGQCPNAIQRRT
jgi:hypothetical protein